MKKGTLETTLHDNFKNIADSGCSSLFVGWQVCAKWRLATRVSNQYRHKLTLRIVLYQDGVHMQLFSDKYHSMTSVEWSPDRRMCLS